MTTSSSRSTSKTWKTRKRQRESQVEHSVVITSLLLCWMHKMLQWSTDVIRCSQQRASTLQLIIGWRMDIKSFAFCQSTCLITSKLIDWFKSGSMDKRSRSLRFQMMCLSSAKCWKWTFLSKRRVKTTTTLTVFSTLANSMRSWLLMTNSVTTLLNSRKSLLDLRTMI